MDASSAALGGSAIANGSGVHGALENPSSLMRAHRSQQRIHLHLGVSTDIQDNAGLVASALDNETLPEDLEAEIDALTGRTITCTLISFPETVCLDNTQGLADLASTVLSIMEDADNKPVKATAAADLGIAFTAWSFPIALHYRQSITGSVQSDIADDDFNYVNAFASTLSDDVLTLDELLLAVPLAISNNGQTLSVLQPEDALQSDAQASALIREQLGISIGASFQITGLDVDFGITPKFSRLRASNLTTAFAEQFEDNTDTLEQQFKNNELEDNSFTFDLGLSANLSNTPLRVSVVARNILKESITTNEDVVFETTPQFIVGGAFSTSLLTFSADIALNEAKLDNLDTQLMAVGVEFGQPMFGLKAGISHDNARTEKATALSLGLSLGPLQIGGRITDRESAQAGAQLAYSF